MCPQGFTKPEETTPEGFCDDMLQFLESLRGDGDSLSVVKEKFFLYTQELQASADWGEFKELQAKLKAEQDVLNQMQGFITHALGDRNVSGMVGRSPTVSKEELQAQRSKVAEIRMAVEMSKQWWARLSESVAKGHGRIVDRERRSEDVKNVGTKITVQQLNVLMKDADALLRSSDDSRADADRLLLDSEDKEEKVN